MSEIAELQPGTAFTKSNWRAYTSSTPGEAAGVLGAYPEVRQDFLDALGDLAGQIERDICVCVDNHFPLGVDEKEDRYTEKQYRTIYLHVFAAPKEAEVTGCPQLPSTVSVSGVEYDLRGCQRDYLEYDLAPLSMMAVKTDGDAQGLGYNLCLFRGHHLYLSADLFDNRGDEWEKGGEADSVWKERTTEFAIDSCQMILELVTAAVGWLVQSDTLMSFEEYEKKRIERVYEAWKSLHGIMVKQASVGLTMKLQRAERDERTYRRQLEEAEEFLLKAMADLHAAKMQMKGVEDGMTEVSVLGNEEMFRNLMSYYYEDIKVTGTGGSQTITATTRMIYIKEEIPVDIMKTKGMHVGAGEYRNRDDIEVRMGIFKIGQLRITIPIGREDGVGGMGQIVAKNLIPIKAQDEWCQQTGGEIYHPHIRGDAGTSICWGNMGEPVRKLRAENNVMVLLQVLAQFFFSYNPADAYNRVWMWPEVTPEDGFTEDDLVYDCSKKDVGATTVDGEVAPRRRARRTI
jgi:hypothetical protein